MNEKGEMNDALDRIRSNIYILNPVQKLYNCYIKNGKSYQSITRITDFSYRNIDIGRLDMDGFYNLRLKFESNMNDEERIGFSELLSQNFGSFINLMA